MVGSDFKVIGGDEKEDVVMFALDLDVGFIAGSKGVDVAFVL